MPAGVINKVAEAALPTPSATAATVNASGNKT